MSKQRALRIGVPVLFAAGSAGWAAWRGVPVSRDTLTAWILLGLLAFSATNVRRWARGIIYDWLPFAAVLWLYDLSRGGADGLLFHTHFRPQVDADRAIFGVIPTQWLQQHLWTSEWSLHWYDYAAWFVYLSYFFATLLLAGALWIWSPWRFRRFVAMVATLAMLGLATYVLFPAAPPWLAAQDGWFAAERLVPLIWDHVPYVNFQTLFEHGSHYANDVAAVPSLHTAFTLLVSLTLWPIVPRWLKPLVVLYPLAMGFSLVYLGEHYAIDVLLGYLYAFAAYGIVSVVAGRVARRRRVPIGEPAPVDVAA